MKRIVILIDGTWNEEGTDFNTNIAKLDPSYGNAPLIKPKARDGTIQSVFYHKGVGADPELLKRLLGGAIGLGLKQIVQDAYQTLVNNYQDGDETYIVGFSRGAYAARALAGLIGTSGIQRPQVQDQKGFDIAWDHYRVDPKVRIGLKAAGTSDTAAIDAFRSMRSQNAIHSGNAIKCVGVFDTVGSYGVPAGIGLAPLARYFALATLGFHDTLFGEHIEVGLHALAVDERRRPFVPTFWTARKGQPPRGHVEQTWFSGVHCNVGGGYPDAGLSDEALVWMISRMQALTGLEFDIPNVKSTLRPNTNGEIYDSSKGWIIDKIFPHRRKILSPDAIHHGIFLNTANSDNEHINERIHWSVVKKLGQPCTINGLKNTLYKPSNVPATIPPERIAAITPEETAIWPL
jgi:hypothetical protein